jgi:hypothetical protein
MFNIKRRVGFAATGCAMVASIAFATAGPAAAAGQYNLKEGYTCDSADQYLDSAGWWHGEVCNGDWAVGENTRDLNIIASYPVNVRVSDDWHQTALRSITTKSGRGRIAHVYCRYADNHLSGLIQTVSIGNGLANTYSFGGQEKCDGVGKGYYLEVKDTATDMTSRFDINTRYSNYPPNYPQPVRQYGSEWFVY